MLIGESINKVQSAYSKGISSDDSRLSNRLVYSKLKGMRIKLLSQKLDKRQVLSQWCYQTITVSMQEVSQAECPELVSATCKVLRSKRPLPQIFTNMSKLQIQSVTSLDGSNSYGETSWQMIKYKNSRKWAKDIPEYYIRSGYLYITDKKTLDMVSLTALFNCPIEARQFSDSCGKVYSSCASYLEYDFAVDGKLEDALVEMCKEQFVFDFLGISDTKNNAQDDTQSIPRRQSRNQQQEDQYE